MNSMLSRVLLSLGMFIVIVGVVVDIFGSLTIAYILITVGILLEIIEKIIELCYNRKKCLPLKRPIIFLIIYVVLLLALWIL
jgi:hypothetical protein